MADDSFIYFDIYRWSPGDCPEEVGPVRNAGMAVIRALNALDDQARKLDAEKYVSADGATKMLAPFREKVVEEVAQQQKMLPMWTGQLNAAEVHLFSPPHLDPTDAVGRSEDERRQAWYEKELSDATRAEFEAQAREGKHPDVVQSLARSPVPGRALTFGASVYRAQFSTKNPGLVSALETRRRNLAWLEGVLNVVPRVVRSDPWSDKPVESPLEKMNRSRGYRQNSPPRHPRTA
jgi:hypothetical protein